MLADSEHDPGQHAEPRYPDRTEVLAALAGAVGESVRRSDTLGIRMFYVAVPVFDAGHQVEAVVRTALPVTQVNGKLGVMRGRIVLGAVHRRPGDGPARVPRVARHLGPHAGHPSAAPNASPPAISATRST